MAVSVVVPVVNEELQVAAAVVSAWESGATEVIGLKLFYTTFGHLRFGEGAAMAWVIGSMLLGFTVLQMKRLSRVEFRTAGA